MSRVVPGAPTSLAGGGGIYPYSPGSPKSRRVSLAYKNEELVANFKREDHDAKDEDEPVELEPFQMLIRTLLAPLLLPMILMYLVCSKKSKNSLKAEITALRVAEYKAAHPDSITEEDASPSMDLGYETESEDDDSTFVGSLVEASARAKASLKKLAKNINARFHPELNQHKHRETVFSSRAGGSSSRRVSTDRFVPAVDVARTDRVVYPFDGVYVGNFFVDVQDTARLTALIQKQMQAGLLGDTQSSLEAIVQEVISSVRDSKETAAAAHDRRASVLTSVATSAQSPTPAAASEAPETTVTSARRLKPKKLPPPDGTVRVNENVASKISLSGPCIDHLETALADPGSSGDSPLRSKIRQSRRKWDTQSPYHEAFSNAEAEEKGDLNSLSSYIPEEQKSPDMADLLILQYHRTGGSPSNARSKSRSGDRWDE